MRTGGQWRLVLVTLSVALVALTSCGKKSGASLGSGQGSGAGGSQGMTAGLGGAGNQGGAGGAAWSGGSSGAGAGSDAAGATAFAGTPGTSLPALPSPREFAEVGALRDVHFDFDRYEVRTQDQPLLDANAQWLKSNRAAQVLVEGHADERGTNEYNLALAERRAKATRDYLVSHGVEAARITLMSYGEERPLCSERSEACWAQNRRAHFLVKQ
ncbi:MAG TPA: peptidoglycan-associated lipoprotein Pal [Methylomirabilota bacterium]|jgi:peptidoglycan-associated lipoprotein|nr:peptidoglycan-associated lipoprotein Pal [Methylomirabilota bacterium]